MPRSHDEDDRTFTQSSNAERTQAVAIGLTMRLRTLSNLVAFAVTLGLASSASADGPAVEATSLKLLLEKKVISQEEYDSAIKDIGDTSGKKSGDATTVAVGKFATTIYGFVETDVIHDSTEGFADSAGNSLVPRNETFAGNNGRTQFSLRNSRLGFRVKAPEFHAVKLSGQLEMDFLVAPSGIGYPAAAGTESESAFYVNPLFRARHLNLKAETPIVDVLIGQSWRVFGWQPYFHPNTVEIQGVVGQVYSRAPQIRISKTIKTDPVNVDIAVAAVRPPQRDGEVPEGEAGLRLSINGWKGAQTTGSTGTAVAPASIGVSGDMKRINVPEFTAAPKNTKDKLSTALSVDLFAPILPAKDVDHLGNKLSISGSFVTGYGTADMYTGLTGGIAMPTLPNPNNLVPAPAYPQNIDNGLATFDVNGGLHFIQWTSYIMGVQYYLPGVNGKVWVSANYAHLESSNATNFGAATKTLASADWADGNVFADLVPGLRVGLEYARTWNQYGDNQKPVNDRVQGSAFFIF